MTVFFLLFTPSADADIFKYVDQDGVECYTDTPSGKAKRIMKEPGNPDAAPAQSPKSTKDDSYFHSIVHEKAEAYNLDPSLIKAVIKTESNWNSSAVSRKGAMGLMQLMPTTAMDLNVRNPFDPEENIEGGAKYLRYLLDRFNGDLTLALAAYNSGPKTVEKYGYVPPISETRQYVNKVLSMCNGQSGQTAGSTLKNEKNPERIFKIVLEDGSVLFTNSSLFSKEPVRF
ncbi:MAG: lytic transglycosylase domain-containing protein [Nitrospirota bacterium]